MKPKKIGSGKLEGDIYGYELVDGKSYELVILHRVPLLIGTSDRMSPFEYTLSASEGRVEFSPRNEEISGSYQAHGFLLRAVAITPRQTLEFGAPANLSTNYNNGTLHLENYRVYSKNKLSFQKWFTVWALPSILIFGGVWFGLLADAALKDGWINAILSIPGALKAIGSLLGTLGINFLRSKS